MAVTADEVWDEDVLRAYTASRPWCCNHQITDRS